MLTYGITGQPVPFIFQDILLIAPELLVFADTNSPESKATICLSPAAAHQ